MQPDLRPQPPRPPKGPASARAWGLVLLLAAVPGGFPAQPSPTPPATRYLAPTVLDGIIHAAGSTNVLFRMRRTARQDGEITYVLRDYTDPAGRPAARERAVYRRDRLLSYELDEWQIDARGRAEIDDRRPAGPALVRFEYTSGHGDSARTRRDREPLREPLLINDMIPAFLVEHWDALLRGKTVSARYAVVPRAETVGFEFRKAGVTREGGRELVQVRMSPSSPLIAALVDPIVFTVEPEPPHRILRYSGRTVLKERKGRGWSDLDAVTEFAFPAEASR